jgi:hypothetical protein
MGLGEPAFVNGAVDGSDSYAVSRSDGTLPQVLPRLWLIVACPDAGRHGAALSFSGVREKA